MADRLYEKVLNLKFKVVFYVPFADMSKVPGVKADSQSQVSACSVHEAECGGAEEKA